MEENIITTNCIDTANDEIVNGNGSKLNVEYLWYLHQNESRQKHGIPFLVSTWVVQNF